MDVRRAALACRRCGGRIAPDVGYCAVCAKATSRRRIRLEESVTAPPDPLGDHASMTLGAGDLDPPTRET